MKLRSVLHGLAMALTCLLLAGCYETSGEKIGSQGGVTVSIQEVEYRGSKYIVITGKDCVAVCHAKE